MDYATLDHLSLFAEQTHPRLKQELQNNGIIDHSGSPDINMINIRTGTFTAIVVRILHEEQYDIRLIYNHLSKLLSENEIHAAYYFVYSIIKALDMELPPLFIQIIAAPNVMKIYLAEFLSDYLDCMKDHFEDFIIE